MLQNPATVVGAVPGEFQVTSTGGASYIVPIEVPPGTNGVAPELSLSYSSHRGNGYAGIGWAINGISAITRCAATVAQDGFRGSVNFDANDRFCLDGIRLIAVQGTYGQNGTVYRTEKDTWTRVTSVGQCGSGPCSFTAQNKDGMALVFGTLDAAIAAQGRTDGSIMVWSIKQYTTLQTNYVVVTYQTSAATGEYYPTRIDFTGNTAASVQPQRSIQFVYQLRPDVITGFVGGSQTQISQRLTDVKSYVGTTLVLDYQLAYDPMPVPVISRLVSVTKCDGTSTCFAPTTFGWQSFTPALASPNGASNGLLTSSTCWDGAGEYSSWADFNGDSRADFHCDDVSAGSFRGWHWVLVSTGTAIVPPNGSGPPPRTGLVISNWCGSSSSLTWWSDFNGDGLVDLHCHEGSTGNHWVMLSSGTGVVTPNSNVAGLVKTGWCVSPDRTAVADFDGDGRLDLMCDSSNGSHWVLLSTGTGLIPVGADPAGLVQTGWCVNGDQPAWSDFNGDGKADLSCYSPAGGNHWVLLSTGSAVTPPAGSGAGGLIKQNWCVNAQVSRPDFNGDGLADLSCHDSNGNTWVLLSTGTAVVAPSGNTAPIRQGWCVGNDGFSWSDFNGDGRSDLTCDQSANHWILLSTGSTVVSPVADESGLILGSWCSPPSLTSWSDFNGDGLEDIFCDDVQAAPNGGRHYTMVQSSPYPNLMTTVTNGLRGTIAVTYASLTDGTVYTRGSGAAYPLRDVQTPMRVVKQYVNSDGRGNSYTYQYQYSGGVVDSSGRGWLGFATMTMKDLASGRYSVVTFNQTFPTNGLVTQNQVFGADAKLEGSSSTSYVQSTPAPGVSQVLPLSEQTSIYTDGVFDYSLEKNYAYDTAGNVALLSDLGDPTEPSDDVFTCMTYVNDQAGWRLGYLAQQQVTKTLAACQAFLAKPAWDATNTLSWLMRAYDGAMNLTSETRWDDTFNRWIGTQTNYDAFGNETQVTDPAGNSTTITYDTTYQTFPRTTTTPPNTAGQTLTMTTGYEPNFGVQVSQVDANGNVRSTVVDTFGRVVQISGPNPAGTQVALEITTWGVDATGFYMQQSQRPSWAENDVANWTWQRDYFDGMLRTYRSQSVGGTTAQTVVEDVVFDSEGRIWKESLPYYSGASLIGWTTTLYDDHNHPVTITAPDGVVKQIAYNLGEGTVASTEAYGTPSARTTTRVVNSRGKTVRKTLPNQSQATYVYDALQRLVQVTDPIGTVSTVVYDSLGRPKSVTDPDRGTTIFAYDINGYYTGQTDAEGQTIGYAYDKLGRFLTKTLNTPGGYSQTATYVYDEPSARNGLGNVTHVTLSDGQTTYAYQYNAYNQTANAVIGVAGRQYSFTQLYDPLAQPTQLTYPDGSVLTNTYLLDGNLSQVAVSEAAGPTTTYATYGAYDALGNVLTTTFGNGVSSLYGYYPVNVSTDRLQSITTAKGPTTLFTHQYAWDPVSDVTSIVGANPPPASTQSFTYDPLQMSFLRQATGAYTTQSYDYDVIGSLKQQNAVTYQYTAGTHQIASGSDGSTFGFYRNGNLRTKSVAGATWQYSYNAENRLVAAQTGSAISSFVYDDSGTRIKKTDPDQTTTYYLTDNFEVTVLPGSRGTQYTRYVDGPGGRVASITLAGIGVGPGAPSGLRIVPPQLVLGVSLAGGWLALAWLFVLVATRTWQTRFALAFRRSALLVPLVAASLLGAAYPSEASLTPGANGSGYPVPGVVYLHEDFLGSTVLLTDTNGNAVTNEAFLPFGALDNDRSSGPDIFRSKFTGKELDNPVGYYYFGSRYYDPAIGQFTSPDPAYQYFSPYIYASGNPESGVDPDGEFFFILAMVVIGALIGAYAGGAAVNHDFNPAHWDWKSGKTYAGIFGGAIIGGIGGAAGAAFAEAGVAAGIAGEMLVGAGENAAFTAMGGGSAKEVLEAAATGALFGGVFGVAGAAIGRVGSKLASRFARKGGEAAEMGLEEAGNLTRRAEGVCGSFVVGTPVATPAGLRSIETLREGDRVLSFNEVTRQTEEARVTDSVHHRAPDTITVRFADTAVEATPEHPFWREGSGWTPARDLQTGDQIRTASDGDAATRIVAVDRHRRDVGVYNVEVTPNHNFFVSQEDVLVHNVKCSVNQHLDAFKTRRPSWRASAKRQVFMKHTTAQGKIRSAIKGSKHIYSATATFATKNSGRRISVWAIDHMSALYKDLWYVARNAKSYISPAKFREISNHVPNLRILHYTENSSHLFEPSDQASRAAARSIVKAFGFTP